MTATRPTSPQRAFRSITILALLMLLVACKAIGDATETNTESTEYDSPGVDDAFGIGPIVRASARPAMEGEATFLVVDVTLAPIASKEVHVDFMTVDGTAAQGIDYQWTKGRLSFKPGESGKSIRIPVLNDQLAEGEETLTLRLHASDGVSLERSELTLTIVDAD